MPLSHPCYTHRLKLRPSRAALTVISRLRNAGARIANGNITDLHTRLQHLCHDVTGAMIRGQPETIEDLKRMPGMLSSRVPLLFELANFVVLFTDMSRYNSVPYQKTSRRHET